MQQRIFRARLSRPLLSRLLGASSSQYLIRPALPPSSAPRNRECDAIRSLRSQLQVAYVLLRIAGDCLDLALHQNLARRCGAQKLHPAVFSAACRVVAFQQKLRSGHAVHEAGRAARSDLRFQWLRLRLFVEVASHAPARLAEPNPYRPKQGRRAC